MSLPKLSARRSSTNAAGVDEYNRNTAARDLLLGASSATAATGAASDFSGDDGSDTFSPTSFGGVSTSAFIDPASSSVATDSLLERKRSSGRSNTSSRQSMRRGETPESKTGAPSATSTAEASATQHLIDQTMQEYQSILASNAAANNTATATAPASSDASSSGVPSSSSESAPALPSAPKRMFTGTAFASPSTASLNSGSGGASGAGGVGGAKGLGSTAGAGMNVIRTLHASVQQTLGAIQSKTSAILLDQEHDLLRSFKTRLQAVSVELGRERSKNESGSKEWVARCRQLTEQVEWLRELTERLAQENKNLLKENRRATRTAQTQEEDRAFLIKQLVAVKKENARLRYIAEAQTREYAENQAALAESHLVGLLKEADPSLNNVPTPMLTATATSTANTASGQLIPTPANTNAMAATSMQIPKLRFQSIQTNSAGVNQPPSTAPNRMLTSSSSSSTASNNAFPSPPSTAAGVTPVPSNMRASLLAAATTDSFRSLHQQQSDAFMTRLGSAPSPTSHSARGAGAMPPSHQHPHHQQQHLLPGTPLTAGAEKRFKHVIASLKRQVDTLTSEKRALRTSYLQEVQSKTQLQHVFKECVEQVREQQRQMKEQQQLQQLQAQQQQQQQQLTHKSSNSNKHANISTKRPTRHSLGSTAPITSSSGVGIPLVPISGFHFSSNPPLDPRIIGDHHAPSGGGGGSTILTPSDKLKVLEWFFSQDQIMIWVFDKIFPAQMQHAQTYAVAASSYNAGGAGGEYHDGTYAAMLHSETQNSVPMQYQHQQQYQYGLQPSSTANSVSFQLQQHSAHQSPHQQQQQRFTSASASSGNASARSSSTGFVLDHFGSGGGSIGGANIASSHEESVLSDDDLSPMVSPTNQQLQQEKMKPRAPPTQLQIQQQLLRDEFKE